MERSFDFSVKGSAVSTCGIPSFSQSLETCANPNPFAEHLTRHGGSVIFEGVHDSELQRINTQFQGKFVVDLLLGNCRLRHTEATKRTSWNEIGMNGASDCPVISNNIGSGGVDRNSS